VALHLDTPFYPIPGLQPEAIFGAMMEILLKTRLRLHLETNQEIYDEDVNAYLAGLLVSYVDPKYLQAISQALCHYDIDVYHFIEKAEDRVQVYWIYKVNADDLLLSLGLFRRLWQEAKADVYRMKRYYLLASDYQRRIYGKPTAVGEVQLKLAHRTDRYLSILAESRSNYLHFVEQVSWEELSAFGERLLQMEKALPLKGKQDEFLDAYSRWKQGERDPELRKTLLLLLQQIQEMDPSFPHKKLLSEI